MKYARRTFAIVSTISIPHPAPMSPMEAIVNPPSRGSRLDADHPKTGALFHADLHPPSSLCPLAPAVCRRPNIGSRMSREAHVRFWERVGVRLPGATRHRARHDRLVAG